MFHFSSPCFLKNPAYAVRYSSPCLLIFCHCTEEIWPGVMDSGSADVSNSQPVTSSNVARSTAVNRGGAFKVLYFRHFLMGKKFKNSTTVHLCPKMNSHPGMLPNQPLLVSLGGLECVCPLSLLPMNIPMEHQLRHPGF